MSFSALNASNNLVDLKSDKVAPVYTWEYCRRLLHDIHTYESSFKYGVRETHNKTPRLTLLLRATSLKLVQTIVRLAFRRVTVAA